MADEVYHLPFKFKLDRSGSLMTESKKESGNCRRNELMILIVSPRPLSCQDLSAYSNWFLMPADGGLTASVVPADYGKIYLKFSVLSNSEAVTNLVFPLRFESNVGPWLPAESVVIFTGREQTTYPTGMIYKFFPPCLPTLPDDPKPPT